MARPSPTARSTRRKGMAQVGGYMAEVDTTGMDPEMKETMRGKQMPAMKMPKLGDLIKKFIKPKPKAGG